MQKRAPASVLAKLKQCVLNTPNGSPVTIPAYPGGFEFWNSDIQGNLGTLETVSRYYRSTTLGAHACTPTLTKITAQEWKFSQADGPGADQNNRVSVEHAYEIGWLKKFMEAQVDQPNGIACRDLNAQFFDRTPNCPGNRMQPIFGALPSEQNPDFIAMSQWLNGDAKGWVSLMPVARGTAVISQDIVC